MTGRANTFSRVRLRQSCEAKCGCCRQHQPIGTSHRLNYRSIWKEAGSVAIFLFFTLGRKWEVERLRSSPENGCYLDINHFAGNTYAMNNI